MYRVVYVDIVNVGCIVHAFDPAVVQVITDVFCAFI